MGNTKTINDLKVAKLLKLGKGQGIENRFEDGARWRRIERNCTEAGFQGSEVIFVIFSLKKLINSIIQ